MYRQYCNRHGYITWLDHMLRIKRNTATRLFHEQLRLEESLYTIYRERHGHETYEPISVRGRRNNNNTS